jgi:hypothetical protein
MAQGLEESGDPLGFGAGFNQDLQPWAVGEDCREALSVRRDSSVLNHPALLVDESNLAVLRMQVDHTECQFFEGATRFI